MEHRKRITTKEAFEQLLVMVMDLKRDICYFMVDESPSQKIEIDSLSQILMNFLRDLDIANEILDYKLDITIDDSTANYGVTVNNWNVIKKMEDFEEACIEFQDLVYFRGGDMIEWTKKNKPEFLRNEHKK